MFFCSQAYQMFCYITLLAATLIGNVKGEVVEETRDAWSFLSKTFEISEETAAFLERLKISEYVSNCANTEKFYGHDLQQFFLFSNDYLNLNNAAFGSLPRYVLESKYYFEKYILSSPHYWDDITGPDIMLNVINILGSYLNIPENLRDNLAFVLNVSQGINGILRSLIDNLVLNSDTNNDDLSNYAFVYFNTAHYTAVEPILHLSKVFKFQLIQFNLTREMFESTEVLIDELETFINEFNNDDKKNNQDIKLYAAFYSHVTAVPSVVYPINEITELLHKYSIISIIDGAHAIGSVDLTDNNVINWNIMDFYTTNAYKWFYSPINTGIIFVGNKYSDILLPATINGFGGRGAYGNNRFQKYFSHPGTVDESHWISILSSIDFINLMNSNSNKCSSSMYDSIIDHNHKLAIEGGKYLSNLLNTQTLIKNEDKISSMSNVLLPNEWNEYINKSAMWKWFISRSDNPDIDIRIPTQMYQWNGSWYIRVSCQIYNQIEDVHILGKKLIEYIETVKKEKEKSEL